MPKLYVHYEPNNFDSLLCHADGAVERFAKTSITAYKAYAKSTGNDYDVRTNNELTVTAFRVLVLEKHIGHEDIIFVVDGKGYKLDKYAHFIGDISYASVLDNLLERLVNRTSPV